MWIAITFLFSWTLFLALAVLPLWALDLTLWLGLPSSVLLDAVLTLGSIQLKGCLIGKSMWLLEWVRRRINHQQVLDPESHPTKENCIFAVHPHHVYNLGMMLNFIKPFEDGALLREVYGQIPVPLIADTVFLIRFLSEYLRMSGCEPIDPDTIRKHLVNGLSVAISPGGTSEMDWNRNNSREKVLRLIKRTSFLEMAYTLNKPVVPVLVLNEESCYRHYFPGTRLFPGLKRLLDYPFPLLSFGALGTILPLKTDHVLSVFGVPIFPKHHSSQEEFIEHYYTVLTKMGKEHQYELKFSPGIPSYH